ncbi:MAG TPA: hypothetical protein VGI40_20640 [Pirellulaceae bacterium]
MNFWNAVGNEQIAANLGKPVEMLTAGNSGAQTSVFLARIDTLRFALLVARRPKQSNRLADPLIKLIHEY